MSPEQSLGRIQEAKEAVFLKSELDARERIAQQQEKQAAVLREWRKHGSEVVSTEKVYGALASVFRNAKEDPILRLLAFEDATKLLERNDTHAYEVAAGLIETVAHDIPSGSRSSNGKEELVREGMLGILGSRLDTRAVREPDVFLEHLTLKERKRFQLQAATLKEILLELKDDPRRSPEARAFAEPIANFAAQKRNEDWQTMGYVGNLYRGKMAELWPELPEVAQAEVADTISVIEHWSPKTQDHRMLLPEGKAPSDEKMEQARREARVSGPKEEVGQRIPLRVFIAIPEGGKGNMQIASLPLAVGARYSEILRSVNDRPKSKEVRENLLHNLKNEIWDTYIPEEDRLLFKGPEHFQIRMETLVDEDAVTELLRGAFKLRKWEDARLKYPEVYAEVSRRIFGDAAPEDPVREARAILAEWKQRVAVGADMAKKRTA